MAPGMTQTGGASAVVAEQIRAAGPIGFDEFMDVALYDPSVGFYMSGGGAGRRLDFLTSPEIGPLFGAVLANALDTWWSELGRPDCFPVVDAGAGPGGLARSIRAARPACAEALRLVAVEVSPAQREMHPAGVDSRADMPAAGDLGDGPVMVLANELLDNVPFRLVERTETWAEVRLTLRGDDLVETLAPMPASEIERCTHLAPNAAVGARIPLQHRTSAWLADALALGDTGRVLVMDYASATTAAMAERPWTDWVRTYAAHGPGYGPWDRPGQQDVTCEVAVDQLASVRPPNTDRSQAEFLRAHGIDDLVAEGQRVWAERAHIGDLAAVRARSRVGEAAALTDPAGPGAFRVLEWVGPS